MISLVEVDLGSDLRLMFNFKNHEAYNSFGRIKMIHGGSLIIVTTHIREDITTHTGYKKRVELAVNCP